MSNHSKPKLTLDLTSIYQIKVPGHLDQSWSEWVENLMIEIETDKDGNSVTILTGKFDQAALISFLRRLYSLGVPLISVNWMEG